MDLQEIQSHVKSHLLAEFLPDASPDELEDDTRLLSDGLLDSISTIKLVSYLEETFGVQFEAHEMSADYLDTIPEIAAIVHSKKA
jgi:acyl carrier protein